MARLGDQWSALWPALAFLLAGLPLAALLDRVGFFESAAARIVGDGGERPVLLPRRRAREPVVAAAAPGRGRARRCRPLRAYPVPIALPALVAAIGTLALERAVAR